MLINSNNMLSLLGIDTVAFVIGSSAKRIGFNIPSTNLGSVYITGLIILLKSSRGRGSSHSKCVNTLYILILLL